MRPAVERRLPGGPFFVVRDFFGTLTPALAKSNGTAEFNHYDCMHLARKEDYGKYVQTFPDTGSNHGSFLMEEDFRKALQKFLRPNVHRMILD